MRQWSGCHPRLLLFWPSTSLVLWGRLPVCPRSLQSKCLKPNTLIRKAFLAVCLATLGSCGGHLLGRGDQLGPPGLGRVGCRQEGPPTLRLGHQWHRSWLGSNHINR
jgi:hypothetical protein